MPDDASKVLVVGPTGQVGSELMDTAPNGLPVESADRRTIDLAKPEGIRSFVQRVRPKLIINAAGYTAVDRAEAEPELARLINVAGVQALAIAACEIGATLIHYSTDYVFDGSKAAAYSPDDIPAPRSVYARTKLDGEKAALTSGGSTIVIRTQWVYGLRGRNFLRAILNQAGRRPTLKVVSDQVGCPTWSRAIARATWQMVERGLAGREGIYHLACGGSCTWHEFAIAILDELRLHVPDFPIPRVEAISTAQYGAPAARPAHAVLDCARTEEVFGVTMPHWRDALKDAMNDHKQLSVILASDAASSR